MKKLNIYFLVVVALTFVLTSCQKETLEINERASEKAIFDEPLKTLEDFKTLENTLESRGGEDDDLAGIDLIDNGDVNHTGTDVTPYILDSEDTNAGQAVAIPSFPTLHCGYRYWDSNYRQPNNIYQWYVYGRYYRFNGGERIYSFNPTSRSTIILRPTSTSSDLDLFVINANTGRIVAQSTNRPGRRERVDLSAGNYILVVDSQYRSREGSYSISFYCAPAPSVCHNITSYQYAWNDYDFEDTSIYPISYWKITRKFDGATLYRNTRSKRIAQQFLYETDYEVKAVYTNGRYCKKTIRIRR